MTDLRSTMETDIVCVGFGPAVGGFLTTLSRAMVDADGNTVLESRVMPGMPLQVLCYERADDISFGVSGVVTKARSIRETFSAEQLAEVPMATPVTHEEVLYLQDPIGASRRSNGVRALDAVVDALKAALPWSDHAVQLPWIPPFLQKHDGMVFSIGQLNQWVGQQLIGTGLVQVWPGMPVSEPLFDGDAVIGVRLVDQGVDKGGAPSGAYMPGMDVHAALTVVGDGPVGPVGQKLNQRFGLPEGLSRTGDLRLPLRASRPDGIGGHLHSVLVRQPRAHGLSLPAALDDAPAALEASQGKHAALVGRQDAAGERPSGRTASRGRRLCAHRRRLRQHERAHGLGRRRSVGYRRATC
jgi:hypothetical protein